jgi:sortase A
MDHARRTRAAAGLTLLLLSGLGTLIWLQSHSPSARLPIVFPYTPPPQPSEAAPVRLFDAPVGPADRAAIGEAQATTGTAAYSLYIPSLELYAPVVPIYSVLEEVDGQKVWQLSLPPTYAVGWSASSAPVGQPGNTVFVGHNNEFGEVFRNLDSLVEGDELFVRAEDGDRRYVVTETALFQEEYEPLTERLDHAKWIAPTPDERLTLVTCWPYYSNTHRVVVVARPASGAQQ